MSSASLALLTLVAAPVGGHTPTDVLYTIERPAGASSDWLATMVRLPDLNGDGVDDLALAGRTHGFGGVTYVFSGSDGSALFEIHQEFHVLFFGRGIAGTSDQTGDGVPDIVIAGFQSGASQSPDGRLHVHSGADGSLVREILAPPGVPFRESPILALDDVDGDGVEDILVQTYTNETTNRVELISSVTGASLHAPGIAAGEGRPLTSPVRTSDRDGDGVADFLLGVTSATSFERRIQVRSGRTGEVLSELDHPTFDVLTGNGEPLVTLADRNQDGFEDLAVGGVFEGFVGTYSGANATLIREWTSTEFALGTVLINPGDLNRDGHEDLITVDVDAEENPLESRRVPGRPRRADRQRDLP